MILEVKNLTKQYPSFRLNGVSFALPSGSIMGFVGENGAGKTTTIGCILNTLVKDGGSVEIFGKPMSDAATELRNEIGVVYESNPFPQDLTPVQIAAAMRGVYENWDNAVFERYLERFGLPKSQKLKTFSRGMGMKLGITVALSHQPKLLVLDEATSGLDPIVRDEILDVFLEFVQDESHSILLSSHITSDLEKVADYITFIHGGEIIFSESKDVLKYDYGIMRCKAADFSEIEKSDILAFRKSEFQTDVLISDKKSAERKYPNAVIDNATIEEIMLLLVKGEKI